MNYFHYFFLMLFDQTFQFVLWAGKTAEEAMQSSLFETAGEA